MRDWNLSLVPYSGDKRALDLSLKLERNGDLLLFRFALNGAVASVRKAPLSSGTRRDELWKTTCFELFLGPIDKANYFEINMSPATDWNVYSFTDYRAGMMAPDVFNETPVSEVHASGQSLELKGLLKLSQFQLKGPVVLGASAVLEYQDGTKEYWALKHAGGKPDFHLRSSFTATV